MEAVEFIKEYQRMCNSYTTNVVNNFDCCIDCPLYGQPCDLASLTISPQDIMAKVEQWSQAHPQKTMMQDFFEKFPNAPERQDGSPTTCPITCGYVHYDKDFQKDCRDFNGHCIDCWSRPLENKLGMIIAIQ